MSLPDAVQAGVVTVEPADPVFESWAGGPPDLDAGLVWLPARGMGALRVSDPPYDTHYFENYQRLAMSQMGREITDARLEIVRRHAGGATHALDVGIGCGAFVLARSGWTWGYDVNPRGIAWLNERGRFKDPYEKPFPVVTLWDVLEHIERPKRLLDNVGRWLFTSLPIVQNGGPPAAEWRHYKPREHCWYWTRSGLIEWMAAHGFLCREHNQQETELGRLDIDTFAFERVGGP